MNAVTERPDLIDKTEPKLTEYIPYYPTPKQAAFLLCDDLDVFYGGAAGGAKSFALLMAALQYVDVPGYSALLIRDTYKNLINPKSLMDIADQWLFGTDAKWNDDAKTWRFPSDATLSFRYMDGPRDHLNYKGAEYHFIGIDEAVDIRWAQIRYMFSRLRKEKGFPVPLRFRLASNPGGISHEELKRYYVNSETRGDRIFIPAKLEDNPYIDEDYETSLDELDPITREQLRHGDWDIRVAGRMFNREWFRIVSTIPEDIIESRVRYWDLASTPGTDDDAGKIASQILRGKKTKDPDWTAGCKMSRSKDGRIFIESIVRFRKSSADTELTVRHVADTDGRKVPIFYEEEGGASGKITTSHYRRNILPEFAFYPDKKNTSKLNRAKPFSSQAEAGNIYLLDGPWIEAFLDELEIFPDGAHDDQVDAASGAFDKLFISKNEIRVRVL